MPEELSERVTGLISALMPPVLLGSPFVPSWSHLACWTIPALPRLCKSLLKDSELQYFELFWLPWILGLRGYRFMWLPYSMGLIRSPVVLSAGDYQKTTFPANATVYKRDKMSGKVDIDLK